MANLTEDNIRLLLSKYNFKISSGDNREDVKCLLCKNLMTDAYQTYCGCQYCHLCIVNYISCGERFCCGGKEECKDEYLVLEKNVFKSALVNRKIAKTKVVCPNKSCTHIEELARMEGHMRVCFKEEMECPYSSIGCVNDHVTKDEMLIHLQNEALSHTQLLLDLIHNLKNEVGTLKDQFEENEIRMAALEENLGIKEGEIVEMKRENTEMKIDSAEMKIKIVEMEKEISENKKEISEMKNELVELKKENTDSKMDIFEMNKEIVEIKNEITEMNKEIVELKKVNNEMKSEIAEMKKEIGGNKDIIATLEKDFVKKDNIDWIRTRIDKLDAINIGTNTMVAIGASIFTVDRFSIRKTSEEYIYSPYFYSHTNGYKLRLQVYPGGNLGGRGTHLSVYIVICKGEYDGVLPWPCKYSFDISIINQHNGDTLESEIFCYDTATDKYKYKFNKPIGKDNNGCGYRTFMSHEDLQSKDGAIVGDSIIIKCIATPPK